jgi:hypothetical protein
MPEKKKEKTIHISEEAHAIITEFLKLEGEGRWIGKFIENAALHEVESLKKKKGLFQYLSSYTLISNGFKKDGNSCYKRGGDIVKYDGVYWYCNGEKLTEENYEEKIFDKRLAKFNPSIKPKE